MVQIVLTAAIAYAIGSIPVGVIVTRAATGRDPRNEGSGNAGATNVRRVAGTGWGMLTLAGDLLKGALAVMVTHLWPATGTTWDPAVAAMAVVIGHVFPVFLGCRPSGKGVAASVGAFAIVSPVGMAAAIAVFTVMVWWRRVVSVGSMAAAFMLPIAMALAGEPGPKTIAAVAVALLIIMRHLGNIRRLKNGTEPRL